MNESNINYKSLYIDIEQRGEEEINFFKKIFSKSINYINFFNSLNINYDRIEKLTCNYFYCFYPPKRYKSKIFYNSLLSSFQNKNNLIYLNLTVGNFCNNIDIINEFKSLKYLYLNHFHFTQKLVINLPNLEEIGIINCKAIKINFDDINQNIKFLQIKRSSIEISGKNIDLPNAQTIILDENLIKFADIFNFSSLKKIEKFCGTYEFLKIMNLKFLKYLELKEIPIYQRQKNEFISVMEKIIALENLKEIILDISYLSSEYYNEIKGQNKFVTNLKIIFEYQILEYVINILLRIFPNITDLDIDFTFCPISDNKKLKEIKMDENLKITKMNLKFDYLSKFKFNHISFENLIELKLIINQISNINKIINSFNNNNNQIKFSSLKIFSIIENSVTFSCYEEDIDKFLNNINNKLMPNLEDLTLNCSRLYEKNYYKQLYERFLLVNLKKIDLKLINPISRDNYSLKELKEIFPNINFCKFENVWIERYNQEKVMKYQNYIKEFNDIFEIYYIS